MYVGTIEYLEGRLIGHGSSPWGTSHVKEPRQSWILDSRYWIPDSLLVELSFLILQSA